MKPIHLAAALSITGACLSSLGSDARAQGPYQYHAITPCRAVDTRLANSTNGGPKAQGGTQRNFNIQGVCGVPNGAAAVTLNVTIAQPTGSGHLEIWPNGVARPFVSTLNWNAGEPALANGAIVPLDDTTPDLAVRPVVVGAGQVHVIIDVTGYFAD